MSQFGIAPFGTSAGPFGGPGVVTILSGLPVAANEAVAFFDKVPKTGGPLSFDSATNVRNWTLKAIDPSIPSTTIAGLVFVPDGTVVPTLDPSIVVVEIDDADPTQVHLFMDARLERGVEYEVEINPQVRAIDCETFAGPVTFRFKGLKPGPGRRARFRQQDRFRDWDNSFFPKDPKQPESTWRLEPSGDIALHEEDAALRKRILRRILTQPGEFPHLGRGYGAGIRVKGLARTGEMQTLANSIQIQVRDEPDVLAVGVTAVLRESFGRGAIVEVSIFVQRREQRDSSFLFEFPAA